MPLLNLYLVGMSAPLLMATIVYIGIEHAYRFGPSGCPLELHPIMASEIVDESGSTKRETSTSPSSATEFKGGA